MNKSSWENSHTWYHKTVGVSGHYYHEQLILPGALRLLELEPTSELLDLACGQGVLSRVIPKITRYSGLDISPSLIKEAKGLKPPRHHHFFVADVTKPLPQNLGLYTHATILLALQNIEDPAAMLELLRKQLHPKAKVVIVLNHPCFRIPRQSGWSVDEAKKLQSRRIDRYMSPLTIPIEMHPSEKDSPSTLSFHQPLSYYSNLFYQNDLHILKIEEWCCNKKSSGKMARAEDRARAEFPLFLTFLLKHCPS